MFLIIAAVMFIAPLDLPSAVKHERQFEPKFVKMAASNPPKSIWRVETSGAGTHLQSTMTCPAIVGSFQRSLLLPFDNFGFDVGCNFDNESVGRVTM